MANWYGTCRSNYFAVKDVEAFNEFCAEHEARPIEKEGLVGFVSEDEYGGIPNRYDDANDEFVPITRALHEHLAEGHVCVIMVTGAEKARYVTGRGIAIAWTGERTEIDIGDIYAKAQEEFGGDAKITEAIY